MADLSKESNIKEAAASSRISRRTRIASSPSSLGCFVTDLSTDLPLHLLLLAKSKHSLHAQGIDPNTHYMSNTLIQCIFETVQMHAEFTFLSD